MTDHAPTPEEVAQGEQVATAAATAAAAAAQQGQTQEQAHAATVTAAREEARRAGLSDDEADQIATLLADKLMERMHAMGVFDPPPAAAPVDTPASATAAELQPPDGNPAPEPEPPQRQSWAQRMGFG